MSVLLLIIFSLVILFFAYLTYGYKIEKVLGADETQTTPAYKYRDNLDFIPSDKYVLLGHHFASVAGASAIIGPIQASIFGWGPVLFWILLGSIFFGGVLDYGSLIISLKHGGDSIGEIIEKYTGRLGEFIFNSFAWLCLLLLMASFIDIVSNTFFHSPEVGTAAILFILVSIVLGIALNRRWFSLITTTIIAIVFLLITIWISKYITIVISKNTWICILSIYIFLASITPIWLMIQPRDYLNSFLLYILIVGTIIGIVFSLPKTELPFFNGFIIKSMEGEQSLIPMLFISVGSGVVCGYHGLISSGSTSKQIKNESEARFIAFGAMFIEAALAIVALFVAAQFDLESLKNISSNQGPIAIFSKGVGSLFHYLGFSFNLVNTFLILALSSFSLTSLDTITRLAGKLFDRILENIASRESKMKGNRYFISLFITILLSCVLALGPYLRLWTIFGIANSLLAVFVLYSICIWLKRTRRKFIYFSLPMVVLLLVTLIAIVGEMIKVLIIKDILIFIILLFLFLLAGLIVYQSIEIFIFNKTYKK